jgi:glycosyltransferase involved in cell wall biosynthesis
MKVLVCCLKAPSPPSGGVDLRCWQTWNLLQPGAQAGLFALTGNPEPPPGVDGGLWRVTGAPAKPLDQNEWLRRETGVPSDGYYDQRSAAELASLLDAFDPDVVILDHLWMHGYEGVIRARGRRLVLNAHNAEAALAREIAEHETYPPAKLQRRRLAARIQHVEGALAQRADQVWVCSLEDRDRFTQDYGTVAPIRVVPNTVDLSRYRSRAARPPELEQVQGPIFLFTGAFHYAPNERAADFLLRELFPSLVERYSGARLVLAGVNPTPNMLRAASADARVVVTGRVPDVVPYLQHASVLLAPLFEGGGTRFKIIEAFAAGLPVISTAKAVEGLRAEPGRHFLQAETAGEFLTAIGDVPERGERATELARHGAHIAERFSWDAVRPTVADALDSIARR